MTDALPITMPSIVNKLRNRLALRVLRAMPTVSVSGNLLAIAGELDGGVVVSAVEQSVATNDSHFDQIGGARHFRLGACCLDHQVALLQPAPLTTDVGCCRECG